jgi:hypothetical protein
MKKSNKKSEKRAAKQQQAVQLSALAEREANTLVIGIDLGDRASTYCARTRDRQVVTEGMVSTTPVAMLETFQGLQPQMMVIERRWDMR